MTSFVAPLSEFSYHPQTTDTSPTLNPRHHVNPSPVYSLPPPTDVSKLLTSVHLWYAPKYQMIIEHNCDNG